MDLKISRNSSHKSPYNRSRSDLRFSVGPIQCGFHIAGPINMNVRRTLLKMAFQHFRENFKQIKMGWIQHHDGHYLDFLHLERENVKSPAPKTPLGMGMRLRRETLSMSLEDLARRIGMNAGHLSDIELGKCNPRATTLHKIERALTMQIDQ